MPRMGGDLDNTLIFRSGRSVYCQGGVVGLRLEGMGNPQAEFAGTEIPDLPPEDRKELADAMIEAWARYKSSIPE